MCVDGNISKTTLHLYNTLQYTRTNVSRYNTHRIKNIILNSNIITVNEGKVFSCYIFNYVPSKFGRFNIAVGVIGSR